jgi:GT2 family glycosyltransferase
MYITVGVATYNGANRVKLLLSSIDNYTSEIERNYIKLVVVDDGTVDINNGYKLRDVCHKFNAELLFHNSNKGIPATWNTLTKVYDSDLIILFNDDIQICHKDWLKNLVYFFECNSNIGHISYQILNMDPNTGMPKEGYDIPNSNCIPQYTLTPGGQAFAFLRKVYDQLPNKFWEDLVSFYEEADFGYEVSSRNYDSYILPFPAMQHWGSQTFALNNILSYREPLVSLPMEKYTELIGDKFSKEKIEPLPGRVYRMEYSRVLFALKWQCKDIWDKPQDEIEDRMRYMLNRKRTLTWLDRNSNSVQI